MQRAFEEISDEEWSNHNVLKRPHSSTQPPTQPPPPVDSFCYDPKAASATTRRPPPIDSFLYDPKVASTTSSRAATVALSSSDDFDLGSKEREHRMEKVKPVLKRPRHKPTSRAPPSKGSFCNNHAIDSFRYDPKASSATSSRAATVALSDDDDDFDLGSKDRVRRTEKVQPVLKRPRHKPALRAPPSKGSFCNNHAIDSFRYDLKAASATSSRTATAALSDDDEDFDLGSKDRARRTEKVQPVLKRPRHKPVSWAPPSKGSFYNNHKPFKAATTVGLSDSADDDFDLADNYFSNSKASHQRRSSKAGAALGLPISEEDDFDLEDDDSDEASDIPAPRTSRPRCTALLRLATVAIDIADSNSGR